MLTTSFLCSSSVGGLVGAGAGRLGISGLETRGRCLCGVWGASGSMKLFSSVSSGGGLELSSSSKVTRPEHNEQIFSQFFICCRSDLTAHTFVAEVVLAASSITGGTSRAGGPVLVRRVTPPVSPDVVKNSQRLMNTTRTICCFTTSAST